MTGGCSIDREEGKQKELNIFSPTPEADLQLRETKCDEEAYCEITTTSGLGLEVSLLCAGG